MRSVYAPTKKMEIIPNDEIEEDDLEKWVTNVEQLVLFNRVCLFVAKRLKSYHDSGTRIASFIFGILFLVIFTIFSFATINYGVSK